MRGVDGAVSDKLELLVLLVTGILALIGRNPEFPESVESVGVSFSGLGVEGLLDSCNDAYRAFFSSRSSFQDNPAVMSYFLNYIQYDTNIHNCV